MTAVKQWLTVNGMKGYDIIVEIHCDGDGREPGELCGIVLTPQSETGGTNNIPIARRFAKDCGWQSHIGRDLCPACFAYRAGAFEPDYLKERVLKLQRPLDDSGTSLVQS
jgi:hypothetical protein